MNTTALPTNLTLRTRWYLRLRLYLLVIIVIAGAVPQLIAEGLTENVQINIAVGSIAIASSALFYGLSYATNRELFDRILSTCLIAFDIVAGTYLIYANGGVESILPIFLAIPILMSAALYGRIATYMTAIFAALAYNAIIWGDFFGIIASKDTVATSNDELVAVVNASIFISAVLIILAYLASYFTYLLLAKERQATNATDALKRSQSIAHLGSWEWDIPTGTLLWTDEIYKIYGIKPSTDPLTFAAIQKKIHPDDADRVTKVLARVMQSGRRFSVKYRILRAGNKVRYVRAEGQAAPIRNGKVSKVYGTLWDVTAQHSLELAKIDFLSLAAHQLRTPATGVKVLLGMLLEGYAGKNTRKQKEFLEKAYQANERQLQTANDLLHVATLEAGKMKLKKVKVNLQEWIGPILVEHLSLVTDHHQQFVTKLAVKPSYAMVDPERLRMVIDNLINNASKYTPKNGTITLTLSATKTHVRISVQDTGVGIRKTDQSKIFLKFSRLDQESGSKPEGSGLGLYLVKNIVKLHRGSVRVSSQPNAGTTFTVLLPALKD